MGISERLRGKQSLNGKPHITSITPQFALPGGEVRISGTGLRSHDMRRPTVRFGDEPAGVVISSDDFVVARVPEAANSGPVVVIPDEATSNGFDLKVAVPIAENLHPVTNPAIDHEGNLFVTFSGSRGQKVPVSIYKIDTSYHVKPFLSELMNAHGVAFDREGQMYVSSRQNGTVYRVAPNGTMSAYAEGMGVATGIAFDREQNLYVGDRSGTIFKIARDRQIGRPQGMAFDSAGNLYVAASFTGKRGIVRITPEKQATLCVSGQNLVGLCFAPGRAAVLATTSSVFHLSWNIHGLPLLP
ncbi:MAG: gluconolaconase [Acidobacteria bacterium]|nr:MAG: gluconolaconase [Acidobacteriota bacterium]